jgi:hypothetical protein
MLILCAANRKRRPSALSNVSPYIYTKLKFLVLQGAPYIYIYIYDISRLRVNVSAVLEVILIEPERQLDITT